MGYAEAMTAAKVELAQSRVLMTSRAYRVAFDARVAQLVKQGK